MHFDVYLHTYFLLFMCIVYYIWLLCIPVVLLCYQLIQFADPSIWSELQSRFRREESPDLRDVLDGREYRKHEDFLSEPGNVSLLLNTDGVNLFKSSTISLWPIWLVINELPPHVR